jgi:hypothetical protein
MEDWLRLLLIHFTNSIYHYNKQYHILIDFDARTGHNHGTKFRVHQKELLSLYENVVQIL